MSLVAASGIHGEGAVPMCSGAPVAQWGGSYVPVILTLEQEGLKDLKAPYRHPVGPLTLH